VVLQTHVISLMFHIAKLGHRNGQLMVSLYLKCGCKQVRDRALSVGHGRNKEFDFIYNTSIFYDVDTATEEQRVGMERVLKQQQVDVSVREKINPLT